MLTAQRLRELFDYLPEGRLVRRVRTSHSTRAGEIAGGRRADGQVLVSVDGRKWRAHQLVWIWHGRELPPYIDHINRNPSDNRIENLRACDNAQNGWNARKSVANKSGVRGVFWNKQSSSWRARLMARGKIVEVGLFADIRAAELAISKARIEHHGQFAHT